jgi:hypothetical protein
MCRVEGRTGTTTTDKARCMMLPIDVCVDGLEITRSTWPPTTTHQLLDPGRAPTTIIQSKNRTRLRVCVWSSRFFFKTNTLLASFSVQSFSSSLSEKRLILRTVLVASGYREPIRSDRTNPAWAGTPSSCKPAWTG